MDSSSLAHCTWECQYQIEFIPKYRKQGVDVETLKQAKALMDALGVDAETAAQLVFEAEKLGMSVETLKKQAAELSKALGVDGKTAAMMALEAKRLGVSLDTVKLSGSALKKMDVDSGDAKGSAFGKLTARATKRTNTAITLQWKKVKEADGYLIYGNQCGKKYKMKLVKTIKKNKTVKLNFKGLKKGKYYKYMVVAYKNVNGQKMPIAASVTVHCATKGMKYTIAKSVKVNKTKVTIKKGKTFQIKASEVKDEKKKTIKQHRKIKYESDNKKVAKVDKKGKITAKGKGKTTIYVYAQNGLYKKIAVTVK